MSRIKNKSLWIVWLLATLMMSSYFAFALLTDSEQGIFLPGASSHGHYQIELACTACHGDGFADEKVMQKACLNCHEEELKQADDSHPVKKFTNPRNADRLEILDARMCVTCHSEHVEERTREMGVTLADDFCILCHAEIADERKTHKDLPFDGCSSSGCHNYHDNRALYEDFLVKHADEPQFKTTMILPEKNYAAIYEISGRKIGSPLQKQQHDGSGENEEIVQSWSSSAHAEVGINCSDCHQSTWQERPTYQVCGDCHQGEKEGFERGRHGMRLAQQMSAMQPAMARQPMKLVADDEHNLGCGSCHDVHSVDVVKAAADACMNCHDDTHSNNYETSIHYQLWRQEVVSGEVTGKGVSCATCHLPRIAKESAGGVEVYVQHNQNDNLRPSEKMIRTVCMNCHGLGFSIDALADEELVKGNFNQMPDEHIESIEMAISRIKK